MKKVIREVDEKRGIVQVTIADERWYMKPSKNADGLPIIKGVPSVTWIAGCYPKGIHFYKWLADHGWDEAEAIKQAAADKGSKVHLAIADILEGNEVRIDSKYLNKTSGLEEELTLEECDAILSFINWRNEVKPETLAWETVVFSDQYNYAGTVDYLCRIDGQVFLIDFKSGQNIWPEYELQVSAYKRAIENGENPIGGLNADVASIKLAILQVGYRKNRAGYKFTEVEDKFDLFLAARQIWQNEHDGADIKRKDYPIVLSPALTLEDVLVDPPKKAVKAKEHATR